MRRTTRTLKLTVALFSVVALASRAGATSVVLDRIADTSTAVPDGTGNFTTLFGPVISGGNAAFAACGTGICDQDQGIYLFDGVTLSRVADINTAIPDGTGNFTHVFRPVLSGSSVAFLGFGGASFDQQGIYLFDGTVLIRVADRNTAIPDGAGMFTGFGTPVISSDTVAFAGSGSSNQEGIYLFDGITLSRVADLNTTIPNGTGTFTDFFGPPVISDGKLAFRGFGASQEGIYLFDGTMLSRVADRNTAIPDGTGSFVSLVSPVISEGNVAFLGFAPSQEGIYLFAGNMLSRVADFSTAIPHGKGQFTSFDPPVISGSNVAFHAFGGANLGHEGIYLFDGATLSRAADTLTHIPHGAGNFITVLNPVISGSTVAFFGCDVSCTHGGVYLFDGTTLIRVADQHTPIPNGTGTFTGGASEPVISDGTVAFRGFGAGQEGIYLARVQAVAHDLAVVKITAPATVDQGAGPRSVKVQIENRSDHAEAITSANLGDGVTTGLVRLDVSTVDDDGENCQPATVLLDAARNAALFRKGTKILKSKRKLAINFQVTYDCSAATAGDPNDATPGDYRHVATVFHSELGTPDDHPADDSCPHDALPGGIDPFPDGTIKDKGCGTRRPDSGFGNPVLTDVVAK